MYMHNNTATSKTELGIIVNLFGVLIWLAQPLTVVLRQATLARLLQYQAALMIGM